MKWRYLPILLLIGLLCSSIVHAQFTITHNASTCVDPAELSIVVGSEKDKAQHPECKKWSSFFGATEVFTSGRFMHKGTAVPAVNLFARAIIRSWTGKNIPPPSSQRLYDNPTSFGLTDVGEDPLQPRAHTLIVWKTEGDGMIAYVTDDKVEMAPSDSPLAKYRVVYPSNLRKGELRTTDAATLAKSIPGAKEPKFLRRRYVRLYWNHWIQDESVSSEQPTRVYAGRDYQYLIDLSALDYQEFIGSEQVSRIVFTGQEADALLPAFENSLKVTMFPIGNIINKNSQNATIRVDAGRLRSTLTTETLAAATTLRGASEAHGALFRVMTDGMRNASPGMRFSFTPSSAGCASLAVVIWNESKSRVIGSWIHPLLILPEPIHFIGNYEESVRDITSRYNCGHPSQVAERFDITAVPRFDPETRKNLAGRLTFLDFPGYSMGFFESLQSVSDEPQAWVLDSVIGLRKDLAAIKQKVDIHIGERIFDLRSVSDPLERMLFSCKNMPVGDETCPGKQAHTALVKIASNAGSRGSRIQATFRDINNSIYYLPIHLLRIDKDRFLGDAIQIDQPLPIPLGAAPSSRPCVKQWVAGLVVKNAAFDAGDWRNKWINKIKTIRNYTVSPYVQLANLKEKYFLNLTHAQSGPEGLVLLAHHGGGLIADDEDQEALDAIRLCDLKRIFEPGSFAVLASCSVGAMSEDQQDNSLFLHTLNENNMKAAVVSPFKVPAPVAKLFLDSFEDTLSELGNQNKTFYEVFKISKEKYRQAARGDTDWLAPKVNAFMLVGDGDVEICKP